MKKGEYSAVEHVTMGRKAWDAYHPAYMRFKLKARPDFYEFFKKGGVALPNLAVELAGDVNGIKLLDICCQPGSSPRNWAKMTMALRVPSM